VGSAIELKHPLQVLALRPVARRCDPMDTSQNPFADVLRVQGFAFALKPIRFTKNGGNAKASAASMCVLPHIVQLAAVADAGDM